jgi:hypothetical protein
MHRNCVFLRPPLVAPTVALVAIGACVALATAGCSSPASSKAPGKSTVAISTESAASSRALELASVESGRVNSLTAIISAHTSGTEAGDLTGQVNLQLWPTKIMEAAFNVAQAKSAPIQLDEILTGRAIYFKDPAFIKAAGKPWVEASLSGLSSKVGLSLGSLLQNLESANPLDQAKLFTASKNARVVGSPVVNGVATVEYEGTYEPSAALAELSPALRKQLGPTLKSIGTNPVQFEVWLDSQHIVRQAVVTDDVRGQIVTTKLDVTSVNKAVHVTLPSPAETAPLPRV